MTWASHIDGTVCGREESWFVPGCVACESKRSQQVSPHRTLSEHAGSTWTLRTSAMGGQGFMPAFRAHGTRGRPEGPVCCNRSSGRGDWTPSPPSWPSFHWVHIVVACRPCRSCPPCWSVRRMNGTCGTLSSQQSRTGLTSFRGKSGTGNFIRFRGDSDARQRFLVRVGLFVRQQGSNLSRSIDRTGHVLYQVLKKNRKNRSSSCR